jgi:4-hydroxybenzoate polyprenyltransferase
MILRRAYALLKSTHPVPSVAVATFTALFAIGFGLPIEQLVIVSLSVLTQQFSVGLSNDWLDYDRDKLGHRLDKPTARGEVSITPVRNSSFVAAAISLVLAFSLGSATGLMMIAMLVVGWSYNLGLKSTGFSIVPYAIGFGILPIFVTLAFDPPTMPDWWVILASALLGISAHFANTLPDLFADRETGVRALPHIVGQRVSAIVIAISAASASLLVVTQSLEIDSFVAALGFAFTLALALAASVLALRSKPPRIIFHLLLVACLVNVILLMLG